MDQPAGAYTVKVKVTDRATKRSAELTRTFEVLPKALAIVRLSTTYDPDGRVRCRVRRLVLRRREGR